MKNDILSCIYTALSIFPVFLWLLQWRKKELIWIGVYSIIYCISDIVLIYIIPEGTYDHFAYAADMVLTAFTLFMYFAGVLRTRNGYWTYCLCYGTILAFYISYKMWLPATIMPEYFVAGYYLIVTAATVYFVWQVIVLEKKKLPSKPLWFGAMFMFFFTMFLLCESTMFIIQLDSTNHQFMLLANDILNDSFQLAKIAILARLLSIRK